MHQFIKTIGFDNKMKRSDELKLIDRLISTSEDKTCMLVGENTVLKVTHSPVAKGCGITVVGYETEDGYSHDYYFPYVNTDRLTDRTVCSISRAGDRDSYFASTENDILGITTIFFLTNFDDMLKKRIQPAEKIEVQGIYLTAMAISARIIMPLEKSPESEILNKSKLQKNAKLIESARSGDTDAVSELTYLEMKEFHGINQKVLETDLYSTVDTFFIPYGMECDKYMLMGEIREMETLVNSCTDKKFYRMKITANNMDLTIAVAEDAVIGVPAVGMRIKAQVWLTGRIEF